MGKKISLPTKAPERPTQVSCEYCNPPEFLRYELGSEIGSRRHTHYLSFHSTEALEKHLRDAAWFSPPLKGADFDEWVQAVTAWHSKRQRERADDQRRWA